MKICQNCDTENPADAVFCSSCGMSLLARGAAGHGSEVQDTPGRKAKRLRRIARVLAVIWAAGLTPCNALLWVVVYELTLEQSGVSAFPLPPHWWLILFLILSVTWAPTVIAWRWEAIGGVMLIVLGLLGVVPGAVGLLVSILWFVSWILASPDLVYKALLAPLSAFPLLFFSGLPLAAGTFFLASSQRSETAARLLFLAGRWKRHTAIISVAMLCLVELCLVVLFLAIREQSPGGNLGPCNASPSISADGRYVAFASEASDLVPGDTNDQCDVFVHDRHTGQTTRISVASDGRQGNGDSNEPSVSADGWYVAFESAAAHLVPGDYDRLPDIFVHDRRTGDTVRISRTPRQGPETSSGPSISPDGRCVAFRSDGSNLVPADTNDLWDIFVHDRHTGQTTRISVASDGNQGDDVSFEPSISADGRYVAFTSGASNLVPADTNDVYDVFVHDRQTGETVRLSVASDGKQGDGVSFDPSISADGRCVAFRSDGSNLVPADTNDLCDIFVHDRQTGQTERVSVASDGTQGDDWCGDPSISADGRYVAFSSSASNLVSGDANDVEDIFAHDRQTGQTVRVSVASDGTEGNGHSLEPSISADGRYVAFRSWASNLVPADTNDAWDVFVHDRQTGETVRVSVASQGTQTD